VKEKPLEGDVVAHDSDRHVDEEDELVCSECEFEAESIEALAEHTRERGH
jgi:hypothetical protein